MAAEPVTADDLAALRERVEALEAERESLADMLAAKTGVTRRQVLLALGAGGGMGALASGGVQADASTSDSDGDVGLPGERVDIFADGVDAQSLEGGVVGSGGPIDQLDGAGLTVASNQLGLPSTIPGSVVSNLGTAASPLSDVETQAFGGGGSAINVDDDLDLQGAQSLLGASAIGGGGSSVVLDDDLADGSGTTLIDQSVPAWATQVGLSSSPVTGHLSSLANNGSAVAVNDDLDLQSSQALQNADVAGIISQLDIPVYSSDGNAPNETLFFNSSDNSIKYKDSAGTVHGGADVSTHDLGGGEHNADTLTNLNSKVSDATLDDAGDSRPPEAHDLSGSQHNSATLSGLNGKISDATLDDSGDSRPPEAHSLDDHDAAAADVDVGQQNLTNVRGTGQTVVISGTQYEIQKDGTDGAGIINFKTT